MKTDWIYCRVLHRGTFIFPRRDFWFGHVEFGRFPETCEPAAVAIGSSMAAYKMEERGDGWDRHVRARVVIHDATSREAIDEGSSVVEETVSLFVRHVATFADDIRLTPAGYLYNLRNHSATPLAPRHEHSPFGTSLMIDEIAHNPQHMLNTLLVAGEALGGELGQAFRRSSHWHTLAQDAETDSERLLLDWMAAESLARAGAEPVPKMLGALGFPKGQQLRQLAPTQAAAVTRLPLARQIRRRVEQSLARVRRVRNQIVHDGYRDVDLRGLLREDPDALDPLLPWTVACLHDLTMLALTRRIATVADMWRQYSTLFGHDVVRRAERTIERLTGDFPRRPRRRRS